MVIAAFDFDGTLTKSDSLVPFLIAAVGFARFSIAALSCLPALTGMVFNVTERQFAKEALLAACLSGADKMDLELIGRDFAADRLPGMLREQGSRRLAWHQSQGHTCVLVSATLDVYLKPWGEQNRFDAIIASRLHFTSDGRFSGRLSGNNCRGEEKVRRLYAEFSKDNISELYAYGDSSGDDELLAIADHAFYRSFSNEVTS